MSSQRCTQEAIYLHRKESGILLYVALYTNRKIMKLKISTPAKVIFQWEIEKISIPTENGNIKVMAGHPPMVTTVKPWIITLWPSENKFKADNKIYISTSKGMVFIDGKIVRIVSADATIAPEESEDILIKNKTALEDKIRRLKSEWSIEEIEKVLIRLEKVTADLQLKRMLQTA